MSAYSFNSRILYESFTMGFQLPVHSSQNTEGTTLKVQNEGDVVLYADKVVAVLSTGSGT